MKFVIVRNLTTGMDNLEADVEKSQLIVNGKAIRVGCNEAGDRVREYPF